MQSHFQLTAYLISNAVGALILIAALKRPKLARLIFVILFGGASCFNYYNAHQDPQSYLALGDTALAFYTKFINGWFKDHITVFVTLIAIGQGLIALAMAMKGVWVKLACIGVIIFLISIAPIGLNSAFPFSIIVSAAAYFIMKKDDLNYLWKFKKPEPA